LDAVHVLEVAQGEDAGRVDARQRWAQRRCAGGEDELVVDSLVLPPRGQVTDPDLLRRPVDGLDRRAGAHVEVEPGPQALGGHDQQFVPLGDLAADVVRQAAVGERHFRPPLKEDDVGVLGQAAGAGRCGGTTGHAADDEQFHGQTSFVAQHIAAGPFTWFHGIRARSIPIPQVSVTPAKTSPAPTKADRPTNAGCTSQPRMAPSSTSSPAAMRTCRSSEIAFLPRTTGSPDSTQARVPPSTLTTLVTPAARNFSHAWRPRLPERHRTYSGSPSEPLRERITAAGSSRSSGTLRAAATWTSRYSTGVRTSIRSIFLSPRQSSASAWG